MDKLNKENKSFSLTDKVYEAFKEECQKRAISMSAIIELYMKRQLQKWGRKLEEQLFK